MLFHEFGEVVESGCCRDSRDELLNGGYRGRGSRASAYLWQV